MYTIGEASRQTNIKVPTIRYYEEIGLVSPLERTDGNQRRFDQNGLIRLRFIKHARELGFSLDAISSLLDLEVETEKSCENADRIAKQRLIEVSTKIKSLKLLEKELLRICQGCDQSGSIGECYVLQSLGDHQLCESKHE